MKKVQCIITGILILSISSVTLAQEIERPDWQFATSLLFVDYFHSAKIQMNQGQSNYDFNGEGLTIQLRSFNNHLDPLSITLSAGVIWFTNSGSPTALLRPEPRSTTATQGIGSLLTYKDFTDFPVSIGVDAVFPKTQNRDFMIFLGGGVITNFIDGDIDPGQQIKVGYKIGGGLNVKMFEFSVHYYAFSDIKNIGTSVGLRLNSFGLQ